MEIVKRHPLAWITLLAALLRLPTLGIESLWYDETFTAWLASLDTQNLLFATLGDVHPPTWYFIEWLAVRALGGSVAALRLVPALAGIVLVPAVWRLSMDLGLDRAAQGAAALVTALAPFSIYYSQEARPYSLLMLCCVVATIGLLERRWWLLILSASFALYLHNLAVLYVCGLAWLGVYRWRLEWRTVGSFSLIGMIWLPWLIFGLLGQAADVQNGFWVRPPSHGTPAYILANLLFTQAGFMAVNTGLLVGLLLLLANWRQWELTALVAIPLGIAVILSVVATPILIVRVMAPIAPPLYILVGQVLQQRRLLAGLALAMVIIWLGAYWINPNVGRAPWDYHFDALHANYRPGDAIFHSNISSYVVMHYYMPQVPQVVWQQANDLSQSLTDQTKEAMGMQQATFTAVKCDHPRWWLITGSNPTTAPAERHYINHLITTHHAQQVSIIKQSDLMDARLWLVDTRAECLQVSQ